MKTCKDFENQIAPCAVCSGIVNGQFCFIVECKNALDVKDLSEIFLISLPFDKRINCLQYLKITIEEFFPELLPKFDKLMSLK